LAKCSHSSGKLVNRMQMSSSRTIPCIDVQSLALGRAREALFRDENNGFILYLSDSVAASKAEERIIRLEVREALIWLNETPEDGGTFWNQDA
jgi:hypothetical protein